MSMSSEEHAPSSHLCTHSRKLTLFAHYGRMLAVLFALSFAVTVRSQTTVNGQRDGLVFNCAGRKTIEQAYWDYCEYQSTP